MEIKKRRSFTFRVDEKILKMLKMYAATHDVSMQSVIESLLEGFFLVYESESGVKK